MSKNPGRTIRLPVGRRGFGEVGAHQTVTKKMQESREGQREARELTRALGRLDRNAERQLSLENQRTMHRDYDTGRMPLPEWAQRYDWHLDVGTPNGLCDQGKVDGWLVSILNPRLGGRHNWYGDTEPTKPTCPQTKYLLWVTCSLCKVALDKGLEEGKFTVGPDSRGKKNRPVVTVTPERTKK